MVDLNELMNRLGYRFSNVKLLESALSHRSAGSDNNERLEFLGDSVLGLIVASELYQRHPNAREGELSRMRALIVNGDMLAQLSMDLKINENLRLGVGERKSGGKSRRSILAGALEAVIGAIYIDAGLEICQRCLLNWYGERVYDLSKLIPKKDAKSRLQEWLQARKFPLPIYNIKATGKAHAQIFIVMCSVTGLPHKTNGVSTTRRQAEQIAAEHFLELLNE
ncbi:ribonuclease III [Coxiella endosymbiont of Amblyomma nuttalli]|uniref:ribonuclease III n=1 Tax=Coxiella endosymbiont of Amblyomma nuttalli TaxID=2749996 RepID=UPI001BA76CC3|nr:ribonuclease III [Coxiella endosymbiont of Amblyomma nuttalli]QTS83649.1 Ribonuclease 3 [Coxiella endosymbiont of Amblyomma nuttalli]